MRNIFLLIVAALVLASCGGETETRQKGQDVRTVQKTKPKVVDNSKSFGEEVSIEKAADVTRLPMMMEDKNEVAIKLIGSVENVCQSEGCWLDLDLGNGQLLHVTFKDEAFVVPKDIAGKTILMNGIASKEVIPVDMAKKIARDEGKSQTDINKITAPVIEYSYEASGVVIK